MGNFFQWGQLSCLCIKRITYPFSRSNHNISACPASVKIRRIADLFLNRIADILAFTPHLRRTAGVIHPHIFIINATQYDPMSSWSGTKSTSCSCIPYVYQHGNPTVDIIFQYPVIFLLEMFRTCLLYTSDAADE